MRRTGWGRRGLSRIDPHGLLPLGRLSPQDVGRSMNLFFDRYRVAGDREPWTETVILRSYGWPKHVQNSQRALAAGLVDAEGDLGRVDAPIVHRLTAQQRIVYYIERAGDELESCPLLVGRVMEAIGTAGADKRTCINLIDVTNRPESGDVGAMIPDELGSAAAIFDAMVARGLLQPRADGEEYHCPIPSMRSWCAARPGGPLHTSTLARDRSRAEERLRGAAADAHGRDLRGRTPLHIAAVENAPEIAELLLAASADPDARDDRGERRLRRPGDGDSRAAGGGDAGPAPRVPATGAAGVLNACFR